MSERKEGLYFVQHPAHDGWLTAMVDDAGRWQINGYGKYLKESSFEVIGSRIPTPDEPWQCVPSEATEEMTRAMCVSSATDAPAKEPIEFWRRNYRRMLAAAPKPGDE